MADELAARFTVIVNVNVDEGAEQSPAGELQSFRRDEIVRIAREAIVNAAAHGGAHRIDVTLDRGRCAMRLRVSDDGCGIARDAMRSKNGFGLQTMTARAKTLGGRMTVRPGLHGGTELEVLVP